MLEGININERISFIYSKDKEPKTEIILKPLSSFEMMRLSVGLTTGDIESIILASVVEIKHPDMIDVEKVSDYVSSLNVEVLTELMVKITSINNLTDDETKN